MTNALKRALYTFANATLTVEYTRIHCMSELEQIACYEELRSSFRNLEKALETEPEEYPGHPSPILNNQPNMRDDD